MTILLTNDDGISFPGLWSLVETLRKVDDILVVAPEKERSGVGKALSFKVRIKVYKEYENVRAYAISGTPADAVLIGINKILRRKPKLVVSGINGGPNLGLEDFFNSGTIGGAIEASLHSIPSIAASLALEDVGVKEKLGIEDFKYATSYVKELVMKVLEKGMPENVDLINVNVPYNRKPLGVKVVPLARHSYGDIHSPTSEGFEVITWNMKIYETYYPGECDIVAVKEGYISITPISLSNLISLDDKSISSFKSWLFQ